MDTQICESEWKLMEVLWAGAPKTLMELVRAMRDRTGWAKSTVTTMVARMEQKGLLRHEDGGRAKLFYPAVTRAEAMREETGSLLDKVYSGSVGLLVSSLVEQNRLSKQEIDELYDILKKAEEKADD